MAGSNATHGKSYDAIYRTWGTMKRRCQNPSAPNYAYYGGRGIKVCERWQTFENFYADMGDCPPGMTLDRINNDGDYEPGNCRWTTPAEQSDNRRNTHRLTFRGKTQTLSQWAREFGLSKVRLHRRLRDGWPVEEALFTPPLPPELRRSRA